MAYWDNSFDIGYALKPRAKRQEALASKWAPRRTLFFFAIACVFGWALIGRYLLSA